MPCLIKEEMHDAPRKQFIAIDLEMRNLKGMTTQSVNLAML